MVAMPGAALLELLVAGSITPALLYTMTVVLYLAVRKRFVRREGAFDLGRAELPVAVSALIWMGLVLFVLIAPAASFVPVIIVGGLIVIGAVYFGYLWYFRREVLETEPGNVEMIA